MKTISHTIFNSLHPLLYLLILILFGQQACASSPDKTSSEITPPTQRPYVINKKKYYPIPSSAGYVDTGLASWYGPDFHGEKTSNGETYNMYGSTAAHKLLPMNTMLLVHNLENGRKEIVRINDRGPFVKGRIIDLSYTTAKKLGVLHKGTARVRIVALAPAHKGKIPVFTEGEYYVQIGSFANESNARNLKKRFTNAGHNAVIQRFSSSKEVFYRVQIYAGKRLDQARTVETALVKHGYKGAFIIAR